jgi:hypothetical protein
VEIEENCERFAASTKRKSFMNNKAHEAPRIFPKKLRTFVLKAMDKENEMFFIKG